MYCLLLLLFGFLGSTPLSSSRKGTRVFDGKLMGKPIWGPNVDPICNCRVSHYPLYEILHNSSRDFLVICNLHQQVDITNGIIFFSWKAYFWNVSGRRYICWCPFYRSKICTTRSLRLHRWLRLYGFDVHLFVLPWTEGPNEAEWYQHGHSLWMLCRGAFWACYFSNIKWEYA